MYKPNNKKMLTVLITVAMVFSVFAILSFAAEPSYATAPTGTATYNPSVFSSGVPTVTFVTTSGVTFPLGSTVDFYISTSSSTLTNSALIGTFSLAPGYTTVNNATTLTIPSGKAPGTYYIITGDSATSNTYYTSSSITVTSLTPSITVSPGSQVPGGLLVLKGSGWDPSSTVNVYVNYAGSSILLTTVTTTLSGKIPPNTYLTVPTGLPYESSGYYIVAQESSSSSTNYGVTADTSFTLEPTIGTASGGTATPGQVTSIPGTPSSSFVISGYGFPAGATIASSTTSSTSIKVGVYGTTHGAVTISSSGSFTVSITGIAGTVSPGPATIAITSSSGTYYFYDAIYSSTPNLLTSLGFYFYDASSASDTQPNTYSGYVGDFVYAAVFDFPAGTSVNVMLGPALVGTVTTDSNGFALLPATTTVPALPFGTYTPVAEVPAAGIYAVNTYQTPSTFTVYSSYQALDPSGAKVVGEYIPYFANLTVEAYGLNSSALYTFTDSLLGLSTEYGQSNIVMDGLVTSVPVGTLLSAPYYAIMPAANGTIIFTYTPSYASSYLLSPSTGTPSTISIHPSAELSESVLSSPVTTPSTSNEVGTYYTISAPTIAPTPSVTTPGASETVSLDYLVPYASPVYPTETTSYSLYLNSVLLSVTMSGSSASATTFHSASSVMTQSLTFTVPTGVNGYDALSVVYVNQPVSSALNATNIVISTTSTSGAGETIGASYDNATQSLTIWGYDFTSSPPNIYYTTYSGVGQAGPSWSYGGFLMTGISLSEPSGTYSVFTSLSTVAKATYTVTPYMTYQPGYMTVNSPFSFLVYGLQPNTNYGVLFGTSLIGTGYTQVNGTFISSSPVAPYPETVPLVPAGTYTLAVAPLSSLSTAVVSQPFTVLQNQYLTLSTMSQYAFPGQIVQFSAVGLTVPVLYQSNGLPSTTDVAVGYEANVYLNGTLFATVPATFESTSTATYLNGSFQMPNNAPGSYYLLEITGLVQYSNYQFGSLLGSTLLTTGTAPISGSQSDFLGLAEGNGALLTGITPSEIATIEFDINSTVTKSLSVPIAQLDAAITSINGAVAELKTTVGNISVALSTINATVLSIQKGVVTLSTELGNVQTSLASVNATLVSLNGNIATLQTTVGSVQASLSALNTTVTVTSGNVANIQTSLGTLTGTVTSMNGTVATISTKLGTLTTNVTKLTSPVNTLEIFEIVIVVLVLITLVLSFLAISNVNKVAKKVEEQKKQ
jgi:hypothetical protein